MTKRRRICIALVVGAVAYGWSAAAAAPPAASPDELPAIKAAIVFNICKFVSWPVTEDTYNNDLDIALVGQADDDPAFAELMDKTFKNGAVRVHLCDTLAHALKFDVVYVSRSRAEDWDPLRDELGEAAVLTVSEIDDFTERGGMVQLVRQKNRLRFRINTSATERADLQLSSQLLKIAEVVEE